MMKNIMLLLWVGVLSFYASSLWAQDLVPSFQRLDRDLLARVHPRLDFNEEPCAVVRVSVADAKQYTFEGNIIGDVTYTSGEACVYMSRGSRSLTIKSDKFGVLKYDFPQPLEKQVVYRLHLKLVEPEEKKRKTLVLLEGGWHPSQTSFGAMVGIVARHGAYLRIRSDFGSISADLECDDTGSLAGVGEAPYYVQGSTKKARMSVTGGYLRRISKPLYLYAGAGYGNRVLAWETIQGEWVKNTDHSTIGVAAELGLVGRWGSMAFSLGCQTIQGQYVELGLGIGFFF